MLRLSEKYSNGQAMVQVTDAACRCPRLAARGPGGGRLEAYARCQSSGGSPVHCARMWHRGRVTGNIGGGQDHPADNVADSNEHLPEEAQPCHLACVLRS